jgi:hypothetical protein
MARSTRLALALLRLAALPACALAKVHHRAAGANEERDGSFLLRAARGGGGTATTTTTASGYSGGGEEEDQVVVVLSWEEEMPSSTKRRQKNPLLPLSSEAGPPRWFWRRRSATGPFSSPRGDEGEEEPRPASDSESESALPPKPARSSPHSPSSLSKVIQGDPHPLRTDEYSIRLRWRRRRFVFAHPSALYLDFDPSGFVRCRRDDPRPPGRPQPAGTTTTGKAAAATQVYGSVGTWELTPTGLSWTLGLDDDPAEGSRDGDGDRDHGTGGGGDRRGGGAHGVYSFHADLHLNPFGPHPRLSRGVVLHGRAGKSGDALAGASKGGGGGSSVGWFRPVVATFEGSGIGRDSADLSYRHRRQRR